ncbi:hypothetical protein GUITHDRAFT_141162 [Guillardia theta CCMP2712]|uniref:Uncharacterized protein n=1 Tax=Guillardia theta (strain CCMP2712) TaxID=905079 RepID=L1J1U0_GUITC|nr:hypothetical protein GUITHDRAFT_141162 [Guillardia theta CCMP2712]EKX42481.1 hypothetical protein GUITHDRAFT_141162 [Guillardia theta CCMP2712]|eukprot:XP_005829461.1 hypothetical protein GUITHDRAFT_141162 [Guillardia theta CCMP2712]
MAGLDGGTSDRLRMNQGKRMQIVVLVFIAMVNCGCGQTQIQPGAFCRTKVDSSTAILAKSLIYCDDIGERSVACGGNANFTENVDKPIHTTPTGWTLYAFSMELNPCQVVTEVDGSKLLGSMHIKISWSRGTWLDDWNQAQNSTTPRYLELDADPKTAAYIRMHAWAVEKGCTCDNALCSLCYCDACYCLSDTAFEIDRKKHCTGLHPDTNPPNTQISEDGRKLKYSDEFITGNVDILVGSKDVIRLCEGCRIQLLRDFCIGRLGGDLACPLTASSSPFRDSKNLFLYMLTMLLSTLILVV